MKNKNVRKLTKTGRGSFYLILPKNILASLGWRERRKLNVSRGKGSIIIRDWKNK